VTINDAELFALYQGLLAARSLGVLKLSILGDSKFVIGLCSKGAVCNNPKFFHIFFLIKKLLNEFVDVEVMHISRDHNSRVDVLAYTGCNALSSCSRVCKNPHANRPPHEPYHINTYVFPKPNTSPQWYSLIWNTVPSTSSSYAGSVRCDAYMRSIM
jgi:hypothetical protein